MTGDNDVRYAFESRKISGTGRKNDDWRARLRQLSAATRAAFSTIARILPLAEKFFIGHRRLIRMRYAHMLNIVARPDKRNVTRLYSEKFNFFKRRTQGVWR